MPTPVPYGVPHSVPVAAPVPVPTPVAAPVPYPVPFTSTAGYDPVPLFLELRADDKKDDAAADSKKAADASMMGFGAQWGYGAPMFGPTAAPSMAPYGTPSAKDVQKMLDAQSEYYKKVGAVQMGMSAPSTFAAATTGFQPYPSSFNSYSPFGSQIAGFHRRRLTPPAGFAAHTFAPMSPLGGFMGVHGPSPSMYHGMYHSVSPNGPMPSGYGYNAFNAAMYDPLNALNNMKNVFGPLSWENEAKKADAPEKADAKAEEKK